MNNDTNLLEELNYLLGNSCAQSLDSYGLDAYAKARIHKQVLFLQQWHIPRSKACSVFLDSSYGFVP